jgi:hypothetical protein
MTKILLYYIFIIDFIDINSLIIKSRLINYYSSLDISRGYSRL